MNLYKQFLLWNENKLPINPNTLQPFERGSNWQQNPAAYCVDHETAKQIAGLCPGYGVGFLFTKNDPFWFCDIDKCLMPGNKWSDVANYIVGLFPGAYVEISQSGTGLHIIGSGVCPPHGCKNIPLGLELYTEGRYVALTGTGERGNAETVFNGELNTLVGNYFQAGAGQLPGAIGGEWTTGPVPEWSGPNDDAELLGKALASKSAKSTFGGGASFYDLYTRNETALADAYAPDDSDPGEWDESSADAALAQHAAFYTGKDCGRIERWMLQSGLVRDKWKRPDYLRRTILRAVGLQGDVYSGGSKKQEPDRIPVNPVNVLGNVAGVEIQTGYQFLGVTEQIEHFKGCVYIQSIHKVFTPNGPILKQDQFNATYGGYVFQLDDQASSGKTTRKAWEAFTESQVLRYSKAESTCFRPEVAPGALIQQDGKTMVNTYVPVITPRSVGDVRPFLNHLASVLPDKNDQLILTSYMAACIQHKGVKFQWAPLLQGIEGNGKTLFTRCVAFAIGDIYVHMPRADEISEKFNEWLFHTLFIGVEDIYVPDHKREIMEVIKPMITSDRLACRAMQTSQVMKDVRCNFMFNTNHKDAIRKSKGDRRFCIFYTAQQNPGDIERDGMGGDYFPGLYTWLKSGGYAVVAQYLETFAIPNELNPATYSQRAPQTSTTDEAVKMSLGGIEQEIMEAIEEGRPGFTGGWVSSMALEKLLELKHMTRAIPPNKRREMLQSLGYDWHPGLKNGRVNNISMVDNGKPRLFIKAGHIHANLEHPAEILRHYQDAQGAPAVFGGDHNVFKT